MRTAFRRTRRRHGDAHPRGEDQHGRLALRLLLQRSHQVAHPAGTPCRYTRGDGGHGRNVRLQEHMVTAEYPRQDRVTDGNAQRADRQGIGSLEASQPDAPRHPCERLCWGRTLSASPPKVVPLRRRPGKWPGLFSLKDESRHRGTGRCNVDMSRSPIRIRARTHIMADWRQTSSSPRRILAGLASPIRCRIPNDARFGRKRKQRPSAPNAEMRCGLPVSSRQCARCQGWSSICADGADTSGPASVSPSRHPRNGFNRSVARDTPCFVLAL
jgi:hypothetical protein